MSCYLKCSGQSRAPFGRTTKSRIKVRQSFLSRPRADFRPGGFGTGHKLVLGGQERYYGASMLTGSPNKIGLRPALTASSGLNDDRERCVLQRGKVLESLNASEQCH